METILKEVRIDVKKLLLVLLMVLGSSCVTHEGTVIRYRDNIPTWVDGIAAMCSRMADRNVGYLARRKFPADLDEALSRNVRDKGILESDTRFYLGVMNYIANQREVFEAEARARMVMGEDR